MGANGLFAEMRLVSITLGLSPDGRLVETVEIPGERFFIGVQFHPEASPGPLDTGFIFDRFLGKED